MRASSRNLISSNTWTALFATCFVLANTSSAQEHLAPATAVVQTTTKTPGKPIGSYCSSHDDCFEGASCISKTCECPTGSVPSFGGRECRRAIFQSCTLDEDCVPAANCTAGGSRTCRCDFDRNLRPTADNTRCGVLAEAECDPNGVQCVQFAQCLKDISSPKHFCKCIEDYSWTPEGMCSASGLLSPKNIMIVGFAGILAFVRLLK